MKNKILSILFCIFIFSFFIINLVTPDKKLSVSERRTLTRLPDITMENIFNGEITSKFESYALDHFVFRDEFRTIKALTEFNLFRKEDYNSLYIKDGYIYKIEYPLKEDKVLSFSTKMNKLYNTYLNGMNVYYSIIPDKNYYMQDNHLKLDYDGVISIVNKNMDSNMKYIDITKSLGLEDYYKTDIHWRQENLGDVVSKLSSVMNFKVGDNYSEKEFYPFYGSYYGQVGVRVKPDKIIYLTNDTINSAVVHDYESDLDKVYEESSLGEVDSYDLFVGGPTAITEITTNKEGKELIIFRDSFGSSIAPLLLEGYSKITLVDLRYIDYKLLGDYIEFKDQDVLLLYNTSIINNSDMLKI